MQIKCRWAPSLGKLEGTAEEVWGTAPYNPETDIEKPCVFFGLYGLPDFYALWRHEGKKWILWAGSDIRHFLGGYWLDEAGEVLIEPSPLATWIRRNCESWVENDAEKKALEDVGIESSVCPSFLGNVDNFTPQEISEEPRYYSSVSGNDFGLYGWDAINAAAEKNPRITYYLYGNTVPWHGPQNVVVRGRMPKEAMNEEIKSMTGAMRMVAFEGCSELIVKSVLWGQRPVSLIPYKFLNSKNPRKALLSILNRFPWNTKR